MQDRLLLRHASGARPTTRSMQKERPQSLKVWPRTAIKRAPFLATHHACMRAHDLPARSRPCVTQMSTGGRHTCRACSVMSGHSAVGATVRGLAFGGRSSFILCCLFGCQPMSVLGCCWSLWRVPREYSHGCRLCWRSVGVLGWAVLALDGRGGGCWDLRSEHRR